MWPWFHNFVVVVGSSVVTALASTAGLWKWFAQKWIDQRLAISLEKFKAEQQKELEGFKSEQQRELERLRHLLSSRISKIHEKEFEVLPKAWLMLNDLHGSVALALDLTMKMYPDFTVLVGAQFEEFLTVGLASRLSNYQKDELRNQQKAKERHKYFVEAMAGIYLDDASEKQRTFHNYLIEHRIFMTDELRKKFSAAEECLSKALSHYSVGRYAKNFELERSGQQEVDRLNEMVNAVEQAIQERLHYEEA
jgi:hypothetical protein